MGRSFSSIRMEVKALAERWERAGRGLRGKDQEYAREIAAMAKRHSSEAFCACDDPLEAAVFSVLVEVLKQTDEKEDGVGNGSSAISLKGEKKDDGTGNGPSTLDTGGEEKRGHRRTEVKEDGA